MPALEPTPSQTVGPFYGYALPFAGGGELAPAGHPDAVVVRGTVLDGAGDPIPDAIVEIWQAAPDGDLHGAPGSLRRDPVTGEIIGRTGLDFTGFARVCTDADGHWFVRTLPPGPHRAGGTPYLAVCVFARGLLHHLFTRIYFPDQEAALAADPVLGTLPPERRATLLADVERPGVYRFDLRLQAGPGPGEETVFLEFP
jgi:protocatechuate 3,4-dioxygenase alpha subunit